MNQGENPKAGDGSNIYVDNTNRRKWNKSSYSSARPDLKPKDDGSGASASSARSAADFSEKLNLKAAIGTRRSISLDTPLKDQGGFFCEVCNRVFKDSLSYYDHLTTWKHKMGGADEKKETSEASLEDVKSVFDEKESILLQKIAKGKTETLDASLKERIQRQQLKKKAEAEELSAAMKKKRTRKRRLKVSSGAKLVKESLGEEEAQELMSTLGFAGFGRH